MGSVSTGIARTASDTAHHTSDRRLHGHDAFGPELGVPPLDARVGVRPMRGGTCVPGPGARGVIVASLAGRRLIVERMAARFGRRQALQHLGVELMGDARLVDQVEHLVGRHAGYPRSSPRRDPPSPVRLDGLAHATCGQTFVEEPPRHPASGKSRWRSRWSSA